MAKTARRPDGQTARRPDGEMGRGELVFFDTMGVVVMGNRASHVGMMIDEERFIHAANEELGVRIDALRGGWYDGKLIGWGRIFYDGDCQTARREDGQSRGDRVASDLPTYRLPTPDPLGLPQQLNPGCLGADGGRCAVAGHHRRRHR